MHKVHSYHLHLPLPHVDANKTMRLLYLNRVMRDIVNTLVMFFLPLYLYSLGETFPLFASLPLSGFQKGMLLIGVWGVLSKVVSLISVLPISTKVVQIGHKKALTYSYLLRVIAFACLFLANTHPLFLIVGLVLEAIQTSLFWNSYLTILSNHALQKNMGKDLGLQQFFTQLVTAVAPAVSGLIAAVFGLEFVYIVGIAFTLIELSVSLQMELSIRSKSPSWKEFKQWWKEAAFRAFALTHASRTLHDSVLYIWPLYVFFILGSVEKVGLLYTTTLFLVLFASAFLGTVVSKSSSKKPYYVSGSILSLLWLLRIQVLGPISIAVVDAIGRLTGNFHWLFYDMTYLKRASGKRAYSFFVYADIISIATSLSFWSIFSIYFLLFDSWTALFLFGALSVFGTFKIEEHGAPSWIKRYE